MFALGALWTTGLGSSFVGAELAKVCSCFLRTSAQVRQQKKSLPTDGKDFF